jgi:epoxyqueuosine reductase
MRVANVSKYAQGKDYHKSIQKRLTSTFDTFFKEGKVGNEESEFRVVVDSIPFFDRAHALESGLGFIGKNTMLIRPGVGSYFFICTVLLSAPYVRLLSWLKSDRSESIISRMSRLKNLDCRDCNKCQVACPTNALETPYQLNASLCVSYLTIEKRGAVPEHLVSHFAESIYGCDICQDVCPYNLKPKPAFVLEELLSRSRQVNPTVFEVATMCLASYERWFGGTALTRAKRIGLIRNSIYFLKSASIDQYNKALKYWKSNENRDELSNDILLFFS